MASTLCPLLIFFLLLLPLVATAHFRNFVPFSTTGNSTAPTRHFEVTKPIEFPKTQPCIHPVLHHDFAFTYGKPPVLASYTPPSHCGSLDFSKIVLEWNASSKGVQYDRAFGVWLNEVELLRSSTAEPSANGIVWSVQKDITRYYSLLLKNQTQNFTVFMGNVVDRTYTGVYHVNVTMYFYPSEKKINNFERNSENLASGYGSRADLIIPISRNSPGNDGFWFRIGNSNQTAGGEFKIPQNAYRAVLEVYVSFHEEDEFWYMNQPNPFREVLVSLDGSVVGAVWPFTVIYTGGFNPLWWKPITGIGSFDLPTYDIEITPFLGNMLDGEQHNVTFSVTNALNVWFINANLHLWLDHNRNHTEAKLLQHQVQPLNISSASGVEIKANRSISSTGWVNSSHGMITTKAIHSFSYSNSNTENNGQIVNQEIHVNGSVYVKKPSSSSRAIKSRKRFLFNMYTSGNLDQGNETSSNIQNVTLGFNENKFGVRGDVISSLENLQNAQDVVVFKNGSIASRVISTKQKYNYYSNNSCYFRNISSTNYTFPYDAVGNRCDKGAEPSFGFGLHSGRLPSQASDSTTVNEP